MRLAHLKEPVHLLSTGFGSGLFPVAPGTAGSVFALLPCWALLELPWIWRAAIVVVVLLAGIAIAGESARRIGVHDHASIVIDEIAAMLALTLVLPGGAWWLLGAFVAFRFFDIVKPWPIRDLDHRMPGGLGIMLDDMLAAVYSALCLNAIPYLIGLFR